MDIVFLGTFGAVLLLTFALLKGCALLEKRKERP
jgi:hypothetical protein